MNYALLIYETAADFSRRGAPGSKKREAYMSVWPPYAKALKDAGVFVSGAGLEISDTAATLRFQGDGRQVQDGPYADTKEQLGGFFIVNVPDMQTALDWAARCPHAADGVIEVRSCLLSSA